MKGKEIPPAVGVAVAVVVLAIAGFIFYRATAPSTIVGGTPNARDKELLQGMAEAREKARAGRSAAPQAPTNP